MKSLLTRHLNLWQQALREKSFIETARQRVSFILGIYLIVFFGIVLRLLDIMIIHGKTQNSNYLTSLQLKRADILDINGEILATHIKTASVYANPKIMIDIDDAIVKINKIFKDISIEKLKYRLNPKRSFAWIARHITPIQQQQLNDLGIPGLYLVNDQKRVYPYGEIASHILGCCNIDNIGIAGIEKSHDDILKSGSSSLVLSIDIRLQYIAQDALAKAIKQFKAIGGNVMILDLKTNNLAAMVSMPTYNPNRLSAGSDIFNRNICGAYEMGSVMKVLNLAIGLESGKVSLSDTFDNSKNVYIGRHPVGDFRIPKVGLLTTEEVLVLSSNIGAIKIAEKFGPKIQREFFEKMGLFERPSLPLPEVSRPYVPRTWNTTNMMSASYGYGVAMSPLQLLEAVASIVENGHRIHAKILPNMPNEYGERIFSQKTVQTVRRLMRMVVTDGTARKVNVKGYNVFAKSGTAQARTNGKYDKNARMAVLVAGFPVEEPKYLILMMLDNPQPTKETAGFATAGWTVAPAVAEIISHIAPILGIVNAEVA